MVYLISIVIPTYNRPDTLRVAIGTVLAQTWPAFELIVIGDACEASTESVIEDCDDARVTYLNLPARFGEQSGPNSVGLALASGSHVAFLNHDDAWLPDHLERAMAALASSDLFVGRSVFARRSVPDEKGGVVPLFSEINPLGRVPRDAYVGPPVLFEPSSSWVVSAPVARRIGSWRSASTLHRTPAQEWMMRAWRHGARFAFGDEVTVLKVVTHYQYDCASGNYSRASREHQWLQAQLDGLDADAARALVANHLAQNVDSRSRKPVWPMSQSKRAVFTPLMRLMGAVYRLTGADGYELLCRIGGQRKGHALDRASRLRTGTPLPETPDLQAVLVALCGDRQ